MKPRTYFARDGKLWRRSHGFPNGCYLNLQVAQKLLALHDAEDWSKPLADQLRAALNQLDETNA